MSIALSTVQSKSNTCCTKCFTLFCLSRTSGLWSVRWLGLHDRICCTVGWSWKPKNGYKMINKVSNAMQVGRRLYCMTNCTASPICDSCNYRPSDRTCQFNTHDTPLIAILTDIIVDNAWNWYSTTFTVVAWTTPDNWQRRLHRVIFRLLHR